MNCDNGARPSRRARSVQTELPAKVAVCLTSYCAIRPGALRKGYAQGLFAAVLGKGRRAPIVSLMEPGSTAIFSLMEPGSTAIFSLMEPADFQGHGATSRVGWGGSSASWSHPPRRTPEGYAQGAIATVRDKDWCADLQPHGARFHGYFSLMEPPDFQGHGATWRVG